MTKRPAKDPPPGGARDQLDELEDARELTAAVTAAQFLGEFQATPDMSVVIQRRNGESGKWQHIKSVPLESKPDEENVRARWGAGSYRFLVRGPKTESAPNGYYGQHQMDLADLSDGKPTTAAPGAGALGDGLDLTKILLAQNMALIAAIAGKKDGGAPLADMIAGAKEIAALGLAAVPKQPTPTEAPDPMAVVNRMLGFHLRMKEIESDAAADRDPDADPYAGVVKDLGPQVLDLLSTAVGKKRAPAAPKPQLPDGAPPWLVAIEPFFPALVQLASVGTSADVVVDLIYDRVSEPVLDQIEVAALGSENFENDVIALLPASKLKDQYGAWTRGVLTALKARLKADKDEPPE